MDAINALSSDLSVDGRAVLSQILRTNLVATQEPTDDMNISRIVTPGEGELSLDAAYEILVDEAGLPAVVTQDDVLAAIEANVDGGRSGGIALAAMDTWDMRYRAYDTLADQGIAPPRVTDIPSLVSEWTFAEVYDEKDGAVTDAAKATQETVEPRRREPGSRPWAGRHFPCLDLFPCCHWARHHLRCDGRDQHGPWRVHHDGRLYGLCGAAFYPRLHAFSHRGAAACFCRDLGAGVAMERLVIRWALSPPA